MHLWVKKVAVWAFQPPLTIAVLVFAFSFGYLRVFTPRLMSLFGFFDLVTVIASDFFIFSFISLYAIIIFFGKSAKYRFFYFISKLSFIQVHAFLFSLLFLSALGAAFSSLYFREDSSGVMTFWRSLFVTAPIVISLVILNFVFAIIKISRFTLKRKGIISISRLTTRFINYSIVIMIFTVAGNLAMSYRMNQKNVYSVSMERGTFFVYNPIFTSKGIIAITSPGVADFVFVPFDNVLRIDRVRLVD